jgi:hypothetical protein
MTHLNKNRIVFFLLFASFLMACNSTAISDTAETRDMRTPVTVSGIREDTISDEVILNATSVFQQKSIVKANINGYIKSVNTSIGKLVAAGQPLFTIRTKESETIGNAVSSLDSTLHFSGTNNIRAVTAGYIAELDHQPGDYVQDGDQLAVISNLCSFVFLLNLPYEDNQLISLNKLVKLDLPDGQTVSGVVSSRMPSMDSVAQTQGVVIKVNSKLTIPENLVARVHLIRNIHTNSITLPKEAVLTDISQTYNWVMKMIDSTTAVRVDIKKGILFRDRVEILFPAFSKSDRFLVSGNFGLSDTAQVIVVKEMP